MHIAQLVSRLSVSSVLNVEVVCVSSGYPYLSKSNLYRAMPLKALLHSGSAKHEAAEALRRGGVDNGVDRRLRPPVIRVVLIQCI